MAPVCLLCASCVPPVCPNLALAAPFASSYRSTWQRRNGAALHDWPAGVVAGIINCEGAVSIPVHGFMCAATVCFFAACLRLWAVVRLIDATSTCGFLRCAPILLILPVSGIVRARCVGSTLRLAPRVTLTLRRRKSDVCTCALCARCGAARATQQART